MFASAKSVAAVFRAAGCCMVLASGGCQTSAGVQHCTRDPECPTGQGCDLGVCHPTCNSSLDCGDEYVCVWSSSIGFCRKSCSNTSDCPEEDLCQAGNCTPVPPDHGEESDGGDAGWDHDTVDADPNGDEGTNTQDEGASEEEPGPTGDCATLGSWESTEPFVSGSDRSHPLPSFALGDTYSVLTMGSGRWIYSAKQNSDGSLSSWERSSSQHGGGPHGFAAMGVEGTAYMFRNGHIAYYAKNGNMLTGEEVCTESDSSTTFGGRKWMWDSAVYATFPSGAKWVVHLSGFDMATESSCFYCPRDIYRATVPVPTAFDDTGKDRPSDRPGKSTYFGPPGKEQGFVFTSRVGSGPLWKSQLSSDGSLSDWTSVEEMPGGDDNGRGDIFVARATLFVVRGSKVFGRDLDESGSFQGAWKNMPDLPEPQIDKNWGDGENEGQAYGIINNYVYVTGQKRVHYSRIQPSPCGS